ncbi:MAG TPA: hypothetical protein VNM92_03045 [Thermoanaerobaculia bacterium]|nr:hypothetical protein [Thermoanaerobaculia bacterium]
MAGLRWLVLALMALVGTGCATVRNGRYQAIDVRSEPSGAAISVRCADSPEVAAVTPATVRLSRRAKPCAVTLASSGYETLTIPFDRRVSRLFWRNLIWSPVFGLAGLLGTDSCDGTGFGPCFSPGEVAAVAFVIGLIPAGIGMGIDAATGAMYEKIPADVNVTLSTTSPPPERR